MAKRGGFPGMGGGFGGMNINQLMKEAKKMQADMEKSQEELASKEFEATAGGGAVSVKVTGNKELKEIIIKKDENNISQRRWQGKNLTDVENGAPFGADENGSQGAARLKDEGSLAVYSSGKFD